MLGSMLAGTYETPGKKVITLGGPMKEYRGMASKEAQMDWRGKYSSDEGVATMIPYKGTVNDVLQQIRNGLASGLSYSGVRTIKELQENAIFVRQTVAGLGESHTHILGKK